MCDNCHQDFSIALNFRLKVIRSNEFLENLYHQSLSMKTDSKPSEKSTSLVKDENPSHFCSVRDKIHRLISLTKFILFQQCNKYFTTSKGLQKHRKLKHDTTLKQFKCDECGSLFVSKLNLLRHLREKHLKVSKVIAVKK